MLTTQPPQKKQKVDDGSNSLFHTFLQNVENDRIKAATSVSEFKLNKKRIKNLTSTNDVPKWTESILYWMTREQRVNDNWSLLYAQSLALKNKVPLHVCFCLQKKFMGATIRHYKFMLKGLQEVAEMCETLNISFHLLSGEGKDLVPQLVEKFKIGAVVVDFSPLRVPLMWIEGLKKNVPNGVPIFQVDAHNIVPCWVASDKLEYGARTIRNKINSKLDEFLTHFPSVMKHPFTSKQKPEKTDWMEIESSLEVDRTVPEVSWAEPGYKAGMKMLFEFCEKRLKLFNSKRNDPTANALSNLSPWFHFGHISIQRCILVVKSYKGKHKESVDSFCEEAIVRRELADNFCFYNKNYDNIDGAYDWAKKTLNDHKKDKRQYIYTKEELEKSKTHDDLWNSAQIQLFKEGKMHGFLRMYWAKKILEWTPSPEIALETAIYLNDKYSMDGRDPNGFVGCMWSICGIHDQGWREREVFGKIRYMNYEGCKRKFDVAAFVARYGGKVHHKKSK
ncbi:hypothetical protein AAG570_002462 [Ranatra chinensis]|uniref:Deoxyribodipyrimidine photo-lyase n=1 Tax=Ranatra chinensis TaxID=642074 RepID=A0ABD0Y9P6_9HEMI